MPKRRQLIGDRPRLLVLNDNHALLDENSLASFPRSKFHLFLRAFDRFEVFLSSPVINRSGIPLPERLNIDGVTVLPRPAYGRVKNFFLRMPGSWMGQLEVLRKHLEVADMVLLVHPSILPLVFPVANNNHGKPYGVYLIGNSREILGKSNQHPRLEKLLGVSYSWVDDMLMRRLAREAECIIALGKELEKKFSGLGVPVLRTFTSLIRQEDIRPPKRKIGKPVRFLTVSRLSPEKGIDVALKALDKLAGEELDLQYDIAGDGIMRGELIEMANSMPHLKGRCQFHGWMKGVQLKSMYERADIFLLPSLSEGVPKSILEAMAAGLSVITTNAGGIPDIVNEESGWVVAPGEMQLLHDVIMECIHSDEIRWRKLERAASFIMRHSMEKQSRIIQDELCRFLDI